MQEIRRILLRLITLFRAEKADAELTREINAHLQLLEDQFMAKGMSPDEARYAAKRAFGGLDQTKEAQRDMRSFRGLAGWSMDLKLGMRMLVKTPGITVIAVIALGVGIGAGASYLEFLNNLFRAKLTFPGGDRLVGLLNWNLAKGDVEDRSVFEFAAWKTQLTTVEGLGAARLFEDVVTAEDGRIHTASGAEISASAFRVIPTPPLYGRPLLDDDEKPSAEAVVVIGENLWQAAFQSDPRIIGRSVRLGETLRTVVGVMPRGFGFPVASSFWTPLRLNTATIKPGEGPAIRIFGRLAAGADLAAAQAELATVSGRMNEKRENAPAGMRVSIHPYVESFWVDFTRSRSPMNPVLLVMYSFNLFFVALLGICAANVAQLVFARTATRENEITIRTALGASRRRIVAQLVSEALVLVSIAGIAGIAGAKTALGKLREMFEFTSSESLPFWWNEQVSLETMLYAAFLVILTALLIGGVPGLKATGPRMNARLKEAGASGATMNFGKLWTGVIVAQVAVTVILLLTLVSGGWAAYTQNRRAAAVAFARNEYLIGNIRLEDGATQEREKTVRRELLRRINESPGVINSTFAIHLPGEDEGDEVSLEFPVSSGKSGEGLKVRTTPIGTNYFETFQQPLIAGRLFTPIEIDESRNVAIVDETFVRLALGGRSAIGQMVRESQTEKNDKTGPWVEIIGVVRDATMSTDKTAADAWLYRPAAPDGKQWSIFVHSRSNDAAAKLRGAVSTTDRELRLTRMTTVLRHAESDAVMAGFFIRVLGMIAAMTLMLAAAGIYSLISFTLLSRTREIGIRTALGAAPLRIVRGMLSPAFLKVGAGIVVGSIPGTALAYSALGGNSNLRTTIVGAVCVAMFIIVVAVISCIWPVRRALKIQPTEALRTT